MTGLALGAAAIALYFGFRGRSQRLDLTTYSALGAVTAEETAKLLGNKGRVLLMVPDIGPERNPSVEAVVRTFQKVLKGQGAMTLVVERVPITPMLMLATSGGVPPDRLFQALETHADVGALVLLSRVPPLTDGEVERLKNKPLKMVVVSSLYPDYQRLLDRQIIDLVILPRISPPEPTVASPRTLRERFDQDYTIVRAKAAARSP